MVTLEGMSKGVEVTTADANVIIKMRAKRAELEAGSTADAKKGESS